MNYQESKEILSEIKKANRILINSHKSPDPDSVGSATALAQMLSLTGKEVFLISPSNIPDSLLFLSGAKEFKRVDFSTFDYSKYDLFICLDSSEWKMVTGSVDIKMPSIPIIVMDHHKTNVGFGNINLIDANISSMAELLYRFFEDCEMEIDKKTATSLLTGIFGDTGVLQYPGATMQTFDVVKSLVALGADKDEIIFRTYKSDEFELLKFFGEVLRSLKFEKKHRFVWSAVPNEKYAKYDTLFLAKESAASLFAGRVKDTDFGIIIIEKEPQIFSVSFRSRTGIDVSAIAEELGGGGHKLAAGAKLSGLSFDDAVDKVLDVSKKYAKEYQEKHSKD